MPTSDDLTYFWFWLLANAEDLRNVAVLAALLSVPPFLAWRAFMSHRVDARAHAASRAEQQGRLAERLAGLFAQLAHDQIAVRIAAVHSLEQFAREHPAHHGPIMQTLGAFVREQTPAPAGRYIGNHYEPPEAAEVFVPPRTDVQAAVTVLGRRERDHDRPIDRPMLSGVNLSGYDLSDGDFTSANFRGSYLCGAMLRGARLAAASFEAANLERADLYGTDCMGASFAGAAASSARFAHSRLDGASLVDADLRGADFSRSRLEGADLANANYDGASFEGASGLDGTPLLAHPAPGPMLLLKSSSRRSRG
jgi:Pentapeptide repeats (8 copies)/Pentapeptide repeats (9 copies)